MSIRDTPMAKRAFAQEEARRHVKLCEEHGLTPEPMQALIAEGRIVQLFPGPMFRTVHPVKQRIRTRPKAHGRGRQQRVEVLGVDPETGAKVFHLSAQTKSPLTHRRRRKNR